MNLNEAMYPPARLIVAAMALLAWSLAGCSAVELVQRNSSATANTEADTTAATADPTLVALEAARLEIQSTAETLASGATQAAATIAAHEATPTALAADDAPALPASADSVVYGQRAYRQRPPQHHRRAGLRPAMGNCWLRRAPARVYALPDYDGDGAADETRLIFADAAQQLSQVAGLNAQGDGLILLHGGRLSLIADANDDGEYETVSQLSEALPADQSPLQASNGLVIAPDGRLFTVDVNSGEILLIVLGE